MKSEILHLFDCEETDLQEKIDKQKAELALLEARMANLQNSRRKVVKALADTLCNAVTIAGVPFMYWEHFLYFVYGTTDPSKNSYVYPTELVEETGIEIIPHVDSHKDIHDDFLLSVPTMCKMVMESKEMFRPAHKQVAERFWKSFCPDPSKGNVIPEYIEIPSCFVIKEIAPVTRDMIISNSYVRDNKVYMEPVAIQEVVSDWSYLKSEAALDDSTALSLQCVIELIKRSYQVKMNIMCITSGAFNTR